MALEMDGTTIVNCCWQEWDMPHAHEATKLPQCDCNPTHYLMSIGWSGKGNKFYCRPCTISKGYDKHAKHVFQAEQLMHLCKTHADQWRLANNVTLPQTVLTVDRPSHEVGVYPADSADMYNDRSAIQQVCPQLNFGTAASGSQDPPPPPDVTLKAQTEWALCFCPTCNSRITLKNMSISEKKAARDVLNAMILTDDVEDVTLFQ